MMVAAGLLASMQSCKDEAPRNEITVELHSRVTPEGEKSTAALLFWDSDTFHNQWLTNHESAKPLHGPVTLANDIDYYRYEDGNTFPVSLKYPEDKNEYIYATGYAPYNALEVSQDYKTLTVKSGYDNGKTDFLACDGNEAHKGSASDLFTNEVHELKFRHLTPRLRFVGIRDEVMYGVISVNNVEIKLHSTNNLLVPQQFVHYTDGNSQTYKPNVLKTVGEDLLLSQDTKDYIPANEDGLTLSSCYVFYNGLPDSFNPLEEEAPAGNGSVSLTLDISADFSWYTQDGNPVFFERAVWENQTVKINLKHEGEYFYPGYEYVVYITFKRDAVILQGVQQSWEDGGIHYLPVSPEEK